MMTSIIIKEGTATNICHLGSAMFESKKDAEQKQSASDEITREMLKIDPKMGNLVSLIKNVKFVTKKPKYIYSYKIMRK